MLMLYSSVLNNKNSSLKLPSMLLAICAKASSSRRMAAKSSSSSPSTVSIPLNTIIVKVSMATSSELSSSLNQSTVSSPYMASTNPIDQAVNSHSGEKSISPESSSISNGKAIPSSLCTSSSTYARHYLT